MDRFRDRIVELRRVPAGELVPDPRNWRRHPKQQMDALRGVLAEVGIADALLAREDADGRLVLIDGHGRKELGERQVWPVLVLDVNEAEAAEVMLTLDPLAALAQTDQIQLDALLRDVQSGEAAVQQTLADMADEAGLYTEPEEPDEEDEEEPGLVLDRTDVPDAVWPSDNDWGVPLLDAGLQAEHLDAPLLAWGSTLGGRRLRNPGTWHFYVEDYRFTALWKDPSTLLNTHCKAVVEPNFSAYGDMPPAVALWAIYRKRWLARWWQSYGVRVFVDLNVAESHADLNLLGVPKGWKAWATRGYQERMDGTIREYERAVRHAETARILFMVYGGGKPVQKLCQERGWLWTMEQRDAAKVKDGQT